MLSVVSNHFSRRIKTASKTQRDREGDPASTAQEMLASIRLVQSYGRGTVDLAKFSDETGKSMFASLRAANIQAQFSFVIAIVEALSIAAVIWLGVWLVDHGTITVGTLVSSSCCCRTCSSRRARSSASGTRSARSSRASSASTTSSTARSSS